MGQDYAYSVTVKCIHINAYYKLREYSHLGETLENLYLTRGNYDVVVIVDAPGFETVGAIKMMILATGAFDEAIILEEANFNKIAKKASDIASSYKSPNS